MRKLVVGIAALLLSACGGGETYQVAPIQAFTALSGIGTPSGMSPLPGGLSPVSVRFESVPADNTVQWLFTHEGDDIARIVARVTPEGDTSSKVTVEYIEGPAPDENWRNGKARGLIQNQVQRLVVEAVDSTLEDRAFDQAIRDDVRHQVTIASIGSMMGDANSAMNEAVKKQKEREAARKNASSTNPNAATMPATDLSKYN